MLVTWLDNDCMQCICPKAYACAADLHSRPKICYNYY